MTYFIEPREIESLRKATEETMTDRFQFGVPIPGTDGEPNPVQYEWSKTIRGGLTVGGGAQAGEASHKLPANSGELRFPIEKSIPSDALIRIAQRQQEALEEPQYWKVVGSETRGISCKRVALVKVAQERAHDQPGYS